MTMIKADTEYVVPFSSEDTYTLNRLAHGLDSNTPAFAAKFMFELLNFKTRDEYITWLSVWRNTHTEIVSNQKIAKTQLRHKKRNLPYENWISDVDDAGGYYTSSPRSRLQSKSDLYRSQLRALYKIRVHGKNLIKQIEQNS